MGAESPSEFLARKIRGVLQNRPGGNAWGAAGAPQRDEASRGKVRHVEKISQNVGGFRITVGGQPVRH